MRSVARENDALMHESLHTAALKLVDRYPFEIEVAVPQHPLDPGAHVFRQAFNSGICVWTELQIDTPDIVGLTMQERRLSRMKRRIEPEPALGRKRRRHLDVRNKELIFEGRRAVGVRTESEEIRADAVVVNADFAHAMTKLVPDRLRSRWTDRKIEKKMLDPTTEEKR